MEYRLLMEEDQKQIETCLHAYFSEREDMANLYDAMNYSLLNGGKRVRPILTLEVCRMCGAAPQKAMPFACAVEMVHTYSLIHDDLPCMDDDDLRRGKPTNHKVYGEAMAVLAGDALLTAAFESALSESGLSPEQKSEAALVLAKAAGAEGMVGGQALDIAAEGRSVSRWDVENLQKRKTGALLCAAADMGCIAAGAGQETRKAVRSYAQKLGLAFQVRDDMLDVSGDEQTLGKTVGSDRTNEKTTFVTLLGMDACRKLVGELTAAAVAELDAFGEQAGFLRWMARILADREK